MGHANAGGENEPRSPARMFGRKAEAEEARYLAREAKGAWIER